MFFYLVDLIVNIVNKDICKYIKVNYALCKISKTVFKNMFLFSIDSE